MAELEEILQQYVEDGTVPDDILTNPDAVHLMNAYNRERELRPDLLEEFACFVDYGLLRDYLSLDEDEIVRVESHLAKNLRYFKGDGEERLPRYLKTQAAKTVTKIPRFVSQFLTIFEHYIEHQESTRFNSNYLQLNQGLTQKLGNIGRNLCANANRNFKDQGGIHHIVDLAAKKDPRIHEHWEKQDRNFNTDKAVEDLLKIFGHYLEHDKDEKFNPNYLINNPGLKQRFANLGERLYSNANRNLRDEGGIQHVVEIAAKKDPRILEHWDVDGVYDIDKAVENLLKIFHHYMEHDKGKKFNPSYLGKDLGLKQRFGNLGRSLYATARNNLKDKGGINEVVRVAAEKDPRILKYWEKQEKRDHDTDEAVEDLLKIFGHYLEHDKDEKFNPNYLINNPGLKQRFGNAGANLYERVLNNLKDEGGIQHIVDLAAEKDPRILEHWEKQEYFDTDQAVEDLLKIFGHYLEQNTDRKFNLNYLRKNKALNQRFCNLGRRLCDNAKANLKDKGGINEVVRVAAKQDPRILEYWAERSFDVEKGVEDFLKIFEYYLKHDIDKTFNISYLRRDPGLSKEFRNLGGNLYGNARRNIYGKGGVHHIVDLAARQDPRILEHWRYKGRKLADVA